MIATGVPGASDAQARVRFLETGRRNHGPTDQYGYTVAYVLCRTQPMLWFTEFAWTFFDTRMKIIAWIRQGFPNLREGKPQSCRKSSVMECRLTSLRQCGKTRNGGAMLQNLSSRLKFCLERAARARQRADEATDRYWQREFRILENVWNDLAQSEDFTERLGHFCQSRRDRSRDQAAGVPTHGGKDDQDSKTCPHPLVSIIDDDETARAGVRDLVDSLSYRTAAFATAVEYLLSNLMAETSCLITDVQMPGMSGLDLQARLTADGYRTPIIFMTAFADERARLRALAAGAVGFLNKPFEEMALIECLDAALARVTV